MALVFEAWNKKSFEWLLIQKCFDVYEEQKWNKKQTIRFLPIKNYFFINTSFIILQFHQQITTQDVLRQVSRQEFFQSFLQALLQNVL